MSWILTPNAQQTKKDYPYVYPIDEPPASPSQWDDEFSGTSLDSKWTVTGGSPYVKDHMFVDGRVDQSAPSGNFTIISSVAVLDTAVNYNSSSIFIADASGDVYRVVLEHDANWTVKLQRFSGYPNWTWVATDFTIQWKDVRAYLKLEWNGTGVIGYASRTGRKWLTVGSHSGHISAPSRIGIDGGAEWFRVIIA